MLHVLVGNSLLLECETLSKWFDISRGAGESLLLEYETLSKWFNGSGGVRGLKSA